MCESENSSHSTSPVDGTTLTSPNKTSSLSLSFPFPFPFPFDTTGSNSTSATSAFDGGIADGNAKFDPPESSEERSST